MPNRFIFSLRFSSKVFLKLAKLTFSFLLYMSLMRINFYLLVIFHKTAGLNPVEVAHSLFAGLRFDLLVYGFLLVPIYFLVMIQAFSEKWPRGMFFLYKFYLGITWFLICLLTYIDFFHFTTQSRRMRFADYLGWNIDTLQEQIALIPRSQILLFSTLLLALFFFGLSSTKNLVWGDWKDEYSPHPARRFEVLARVFIPLLAIFFAARGTVEAHHLELQHSIVSENTQLNELALNAVWCFDK